MFEHVGRDALRRVRRARSTSCSRPAAGCSTTASADRPADDDRRPRRRTRGRSRLPPHVHRPLRVPRRRAPRGRVGGVDDPAGGVRGPPRREAARALRPHAARVGRQPRGRLGRGRRGGRRGRARVWRLYMAASAINFEAGRTQIHQVLAVKPDGGRAACRCGRTSSSRGAAGRDSLIIRCCVTTTSVQTVGSAGMAGSRGGKRLRATASRPRPVEPFTPAGALEPVELGAGDQRVAAGPLAGRSTAPPADRAAAPCVRRARRGRNASQNPTANASPAPLVSTTGRLSVVAGA